MSAKENRGELKVNLKEFQDTFSKNVKEFNDLQRQVENNSFFGQQNKRFSGFDIIHQFNNNFVIGGTLINLSENPLTQKANYGTRNTP